MTPLAILAAILLAPPDAAREEKVKTLIREIAESGRTMAAGEPAKDRLADPRKQLAPGQPPLLSFRYFDGVARHRFGKLDLMLDDAGH